MTTIQHTATNSLIQMDDAALAADVAFALDLKHLIQRPITAAAIHDAGAARRYAPEDVTLVVELVRDAQGILVRHGTLQAVTV